MLSIARKERRLAASAVDPAFCLCGDRVATTLRDLGSLWCHDCREDADRRALVLQQIRMRGSRRRRALPWTRTVLRPST
jgi:hypothetical protein